MGDVLNAVTEAVENFNSLDWVIVVVVAFSMLLGLVRGFGREVLSLLGWVFAFVAANILAQSLASSLVSVSESATLRYLLAWGLVFIGVLAIFSVLGSLLSKQLRQPGFNLGNRLFGAIFGVMRGLIVVMVGTLILKGILPDSEEQWLDEAELMPLIDTMADWFSENFDGFLEQKPVIEMGDSLESAEML